MEKTIYTGMYTETAYQVLEVIVRASKQKRNGNVNIYSNGKPIRFMSGDLLKYSNEFESAVALTMLVHISPMGELFIKGNFGQNLPGFNDNFHVDGLLNAMHNYVVSYIQSDYKKATMGDFYKRYFSMPSKNVHKDYLLKDVIDVIYDYLKNPNIKKVSDKHDAELVKAIVGEPADPFKEVLIEDAITDLQKVLNTPFDDYQKIYGSFNDTYKRVIELFTKKKRDLLSLLYN